MLTFLKTLFVLFIAPLIGTFLTLPLMQWLLGVSMTFSGASSVYVGLLAYSFCTLLVVWGLIMIILVVLLAIFGTEILEKLPK